MTSTPQNSLEPPAASLLSGWTLPLIVTGALALRLNGISGTWLWFDEQFGAAFAQLGPIELAVASIRFDIHPPFWAWQLSVWNLFGQSDTWLLLNSILWSVLGIVSLWWTSSRIFNRRTALAAALLLAVLPVAVSHARFLRMYPMLMTVVIWSWYFTNRVLVGNGTRWDLIRAAVAGLVVSYIHGVGLLINAYVGLYGLMLIATEDVPKPRRWRWLKMESVVAVLSLGAVPYAVIKRVAHTAVPTLDGMTATLADYWFGMTWGQSAEARVVAVLLVMAIALQCVRDREARSTLLAFVLLPVFATAAASFLLRPIWHLHALLFSIPFAALGIGRLVTHPSSRRIVSALQTTGLVSALVVFLCFSAYAVSSFEKETDYLWAVDYIDEHSGPNDLVNVVENPHFWAIARYCVGESWGSILEVQPLRRTNGRWGQVLDRIGPVWRRRLYLEPDACHIEHDGRTFVIGRDIPESLSEQRPPRIVVVRESSDDACEFPDYVESSFEQRGRLQVFVFEYSAAPDSVLTSQSAG